VLVGNAGNDLLNLGLADDQSTVSYADAPGRVHVLRNESGETRATGDGTDTLVNLGAVAGSPFADTFDIRRGLYGVFGAEGNDVFYMAAQVGEFSAAQGIDVINLSDLPGGLEAEFGFSAGEGDDLMVGSTSGDRLDLSGDPGDNTIDAGWGDDTLTVADGVESNDTIKAGEGTDTCSGDAGDD
jgi:hypothetical protein